MKCARKNGIKILDISSDYNVFKNASFNNNYKNEDKFQDLQKYTHKTIFNKKLKNL